MNEISAILSAIRRSILLEIYFQTLAEVPHTEQLRLLKMLLLIKEAQLKIKLLSTPDLGTSEEDEIILTRFLELTLQENDDGTTPQ